jgi:hypothetical protein
MNIQFTQLFKEAANIIWNNKLQGFIAVFVPVLIGVVITIVLALTLYGLILLPLVWAAVIFMMYKMSLSIARTNNANFDESFKLGGSLQLLVYGIL